MDIPTFIDLPNLVYLSFSRNALSGPIPPSIGTLTKLVVLDLSFNGLNGSIPTSIDVPNLVYLNFSRNALSGPIPSSIGALTKIMVLDLSFNGLNGSIPTSLGNCTKLNSTMPSTLRTLGNLMNLSILQTCPILTI
uniref:LRR receptor-like serine/threonine-protein kinase n=1 Tax=Aegilops tauschii subsp. strangulata TaxID=200361 RepID=A0A452XQV1_AEGTS